MYILAIETTGARASAAVAGQGGLMREAIADGTLNHLQTVVPLVSDLLEKCQLTIDDITAIAVSEGPGSFTGIRIGVSTARALAQAAHRPLIGVPTLHTFAYQLADLQREKRGRGAGAAGGEGPGGEAAEEAAEIACPIFDARRSQVYGGACRLTAGDEIEELVTGGAYALEEYLALLAKACQGRLLRPVFFGDGIRAYEQQVLQWAGEFGLAADLAPEGFRLQRAASAAQLALALYRKGRCVSYEEMHPNYMRMAEAQRRLEEGTLPQADQTRAARGREGKRG